MPPNLTKTTSNRVLLLRPQINRDSDEESISSPEPQEPSSSQVAVPLEHNLRALLVQVCGTDQLERVTQVKLRVIAREVSLQHLSVHIPSLRELVLDGSVVSSLRDLGCALKGLRILRLNRCGLTAIDSTAGLEGLEELYVADNAIENAIPCAFLPHIKVIDLSRNRLCNAMHSLRFLAICEQLEHIHLGGNREICQLPTYRRTVRRLLPALQSLDGITFTEDETNRKVENGRVESGYNRHVENSTPSTVVEAPPTSRNKTVVTSFTIRFPPKVLQERKNS